MKKTLCMLIILFFVTMSTASAELFNDLDRAVTEYNAYYEELPGSIQIVLGNEKILAGILMDDGNELNVWLITKNGRVTEFEKVGDVRDYDPTVIIATDETTVRKLINTTDPLSVYEESRSNGTLIIDPVGIVNNAKFVVADLASRLFKSIGFI
ncbi:MAG: hypothetical protein WBL02_02865 [Methanomethylovorans sp.]|uniref:hypothetical protein n=1 Tax=Methanomethylovorans sp. TaxID=2758717 RepID=UPI000B3105CE|nr:hypothetical protein [Methanomethylovorans sp.]